MNMFRTLTLIFLAACSLAAFTARPLAIDSQLDLPSVVPDSVLLATLDGDFEAALAAVREQISDAEGGASNWLFAEALLLERMGKTDAAITKFTVLVEDQVHTAFAPKARFSLANLFEETGEHSRAAALWSQATEDLGGQARLDDLARLLIRVAVKDLPAGLMHGELSTARFQATKILHAALNLNPSPAVRLHLQSLLADRYEAWGKPREAADAIAAWLELESGTQKDRTSILAQRMRRADLLATGLASDDAIEAYLAIELDLKSEDPQFARRALLGRAREIAEQSQATARADALKLMELYLQSSQAADRILVATEAAQLMEALKRDARGAWELVLQLSDEAKPLDSRDFELARSAAFRLALEQHKMGANSAAMATYRLYIQRYPDGPNWGACQAALLKIELEVAEDFHGAQQFEAARAAWGAFAAAHPTHTDTLSIQALIAESYLDEAELQTESDEVEHLLRRSIEEFERIAQMNPGNFAGERALLDIASIHEDKRSDLPAAIRTWERAREHFSSRQAVMDLSRVKSVWLAVGTSGSLNSTGVPHVELTARNLESVEVEIYKLDLESYFRRHHGYRGVQNLDLELIEADEIFSFPIKPDSPHALVNCHIDLDQYGVDGPGTWVISVLSAKSRATTLLLVSDIQIAVSQSGLDAVAFAKDTLTGEPASDVHLLVNVGPDFYEAVTDQDGLAKVSVEAKPGILSWFAKRGDHVAALGTSQTRSTAPPTGSAGFVYTERGTYRSGERVFWKAVVRDRDDQGHFTFDAGAPYEITITSPSGIEVLSDSMTLSSFGSLSGELELPSAAPVGTYSIQVSRDGTSLSGLFAVRSFRLPKVRLEVQPKHPVLLPGQTQTLHFTATYNHGAPMPNATIQGVLRGAKDLHHEIVTDEHGQATIDFEALQLKQPGLSNQVTFEYILGTAEAKASGSFFMAGRELSVVLSSDRALHLPGEPFEVSIFAEDIFGEAAARDFQLTVNQLVNAPNGERIERFQSQLPLATTADGWGRTDLVLTSAGDFILRIEGQDRLGQLVTDSIEIQVVGERYPDKLFFLNDSTSFEVGEAVSMRLENQAGPGPALVTWSRNGIAQYRLIRLKTGTNQLIFEATTDLAPRAMVHVLHMDAGALHIAEQSFRVKRNLDIQFSVNGDVFKPGATADVELRVTDSHGNPIEAELSLGLVNGAFYDLFPDAYTGYVDCLPLGDIQLQSQRTASSLSFQDHGGAKAIAAALLAEQKREIIEEQESERIVEAQDWLSAQEQGATFRGSGDTVPSSPSAPGAGSPAPASPGGSIPASPGSGDWFLGSGSQKMGGRSAQAITHDQLKSNATVFWQPKIVTNQNGLAQLQIKLPSTSGRWRFTSRGIDGTSRLGEATAEVITRADFLVEMIAPGILHVGDSLTPMARVIWSGVGPAAAVVSFAGELGESSFGVSKQTLHFDAPGIQTYSLGGLPASAQAIDCRLTLDGSLVSAEGTHYQAQANHRIEVRPAGLPVAVQQSGLLDDTVVTQIQLPEARVDDQKLDIYVGAGMASLLSEASLGTGMFGSIHIAPSSLLESTSNLAGDLLGAVHVWRGLEGAGTTQAELRAALKRRMSALAGAILLRQDSQGAFSGLVRRQSMAIYSNVESSAHALIALGAAAQPLGLDSEALAQAATYLSNSLRNLEFSDFETRAHVLHALSAVGQAKVDQTASIMRMRAGLNMAASSHLALAMANMGRQGDAHDLATRVAGLAAGTADFGASDCGPWHGDPQALNALAVWAMTEALGDRSNEQLNRATEQLVALAPWPSGEVRGAALAGLASLHYEDLGVHASQSVRVVLFQDSQGQETLVHDFTIETGTTGAQRSFSIPPGLAKAPIKVRFEALTTQSSLRPTWYLRLSGFTDLMSTSPDANTVLVEAPSPILGHELLKTGFGILKGRTEKWLNTVTHLSPGQTAKVSIFSLRHQAKSKRSTGLYDKWQIPLPAGFVIVPGSLDASGSLVSMDDNMLNLKIAHSAMGRCSFELMALVEGTYTAPQGQRTNVQAGTQPQLSKPWKLTVIPTGTENPDVYRITPDERLARGLKMQSAGQLEPALNMLLGLFDEYEGLLTSSATRRLSSALLDLSIALPESSSASQVVRFFEIQSAVDPQRFLSIDQVIAVGEAYRAMGESEHASVLLRATINEYFRRDMGLVGILEENASFHEHTQLQEALWHVYPNTPTVRDTRLALTDSLLQYASHARADIELFQAHRDRVSLTLEAVLFLREMLLFEEDENLLSEVAMNLLTAYSALDDYPRTERLAQSFANHFEDKRLADSFRYVRAIALWQTGNESGALDLLQQIAKATYTDGSNEGASENRELAIYLMAQIHHAQGDLSTADRLYDKVKWQFTDAREIRLLLKSKSLAVAEVATCKPGETPVLKVTSKGVDQVDMQVYPVDLLALYLREGDLEDVSKINLAGITPVLRETRQLINNLSLQAVEAELEMPVFEPGAYLVILRGADLFASGLVVVSDLELFVDEDPDTGQVRTSITRDGAAVAGVDVRIVGSNQSGKVIAGETDRRGLFKAGPINGVATVIARLDRRNYAFHRGTTPLLDQDVRYNRRKKSQDQAAEEVDWLSNVNALNGLKIKSRGASQVDLRNNKSQGVQILTVK